MFDVRCSMFDVRCSHFNFKLDPFTPPPASPQLATAEAEEVQASALIHPLIRMEWYIVSSGCQLRDSPTAGPITAVPSQSMSALAIGANPRGRKCHQLGRNPA